MRALPLCQGLQSSQISAVASVFSVSRHRAAHFVRFTLPHFFHDHALADQPAPTSSEWLVPRLPSDKLAKSEILQTHTVSPARNLLGHSNNSHSALAMSRSTNHFRSSRRSVGRLRGVKGGEGGRRKARQYPTTASSRSSFALSNAARQPKSSESSQDHRTAGGRRAGRRRQRRERQQWPDCHRPLGLWYKNKARLVVSPGASGPVIICKCHCHFRRHFRPSDARQRLAPLTKSPSKAVDTGPSRSALPN